MHLLIVVAEWRGVSRALEEVLYINILRKVHTQFQTTFLPCWSWARASEGAGSHQKIDAHGSEQPHLFPVHCVFKRQPSMSHALSCKVDCADSRVGDDVQVSLWDGGEAQAAAIELIVFFAGALVRCVEPKTW